LSETTETLLIRVFLDFSLRKAVEVDWNTFSQPV